MEIIQLWTFWTFFWTFYLNHLSPLWGYFYSCVCVLVCMFHSSIFTMASNITPNEDKPMHPAGLDMTHGSLQEILDAEDVNISTALPTVPLDATNPFINPN